MPKKTIRLRCARTPAREIEKFFIPRHAAIIKNGSRKKCRFFLYRTRRYIIKNESRKNIIFFLPQILLLEITLFLTKQLKFQENIWTLIDRKASVELKSRPHSQIFGPAGKNQRFDPFQMLLQAYSGNKVPKISPDAAGVAGIVSLKSNW